MDWHSFMEKLMQSFNEKIKQKNHKNLKYYNINIDKILKNICLLHWVLAVACRIFVCGAQTL